MQQTNWFDRKFDFSGDLNIFPSILERLTGTPGRVKKKVELVSSKILTAKPGGKWSLQEQVGHLIDLEPLWQTRLADILSESKYLSLADLSNKKTHEANHNGRSIESLLDEFEMVRTDTLVKLERLTEADIYKSAIHPRLLTPMRTMDLFLFVAEHDDHHLVKMSELIRELN